MKTKSLLFIFVFSGITVTYGIAQQTVSIESLLKEMIDRDAMAKYPDPVFTCKQFSSYDRATVAKDKPGWFANWDRGMFIRSETVEGRKEFVMMDSEGPGAIVRFWMTFGVELAGRGILRIYVDDNPQPVIIGEAFDVLSGNIVAKAPLAASVSDLSPYHQRGHNLYFPIPYAKRCKVTYQSNIAKGAKPDDINDIFYNINYRTYTLPVKAVSYSAVEVKKNKSLIAKVQEQLQGRDKGLEKKKQTSISLNATLKQGESKSFSIEGTHAIRHLSIQLEASDKEQALRSTVVEMAFDGEKTVWVPVGDFFGIGYHQLYTNTWYTQASDDGKMDAFWIMPFKEKCTVTLHNLGRQDVTIRNAVAEYGNWKWDQRSMHFGVNWWQYTRILAGAYEQALDVNFATLVGKGVYVGDGVTLFNTASHTWWGEGDEKVYVDGESFPSHIGTGTEDYYGYAWGLPAAFTGHPYIAQPDGNGNLEPGYTVNTRYRGLDRIPFTQSLQFDLELFQWTRTRINYAPAAYWYILPGGRSMHTEDIAGAQEKVAMKRNDIYPNKLSLDLEGENLETGEMTSGKIQYQDQLRGIWSEGLQIYWMEIKKGGKATFKFENGSPGEYSLMVQFIIAPDYGKFNVYLNGKQITRDLDLYHTVVAVKKIELGTVTLQKGQNTLTFELADYPPNQSVSCFGIDKLIFNDSPVFLPK